MKTNLLVLAAVILGFVSTNDATAEQGVSSDTVVLGMSNSLSGPAAALGTGMKKGALVYFNKVNAAGGVHGRKIKVISYDDGYEPKRTVANTEKLIGEDKVFALFGYVGTPTSKAVLPIVSREKIIYFGPFSGAEFLRNPVNKYVFNVRGSYYDEAEMQIDYLTKARGVKNVGLFLQNDDYGMAVKDGLVAALKRRNTAPVSEGLYTRNTEDVDAALETLKKDKPEAVSMVGTYKAMAAFIRKAKQQGFNPVFLNVSFVGTSALNDALGAAGDGVIVTQVMPSPYEPAVPIVEQYQKDMKAAGFKEFDYTDLEGYVDAVVFTEILKAAGPNLTRESFIKTAESMDFSQGGLHFRFSPDSHQALKTVYIVRFAGGKVKPIVRRLGRYEVQ